MSYAPGTTDSPSFSQQSFLDSLFDIWFGTPCPFQTGGTSDITLGSEPPAFNHVLEYEHFNHSYNISEVGLDLCQEVAPAASAAFDSRDAQYTLPVQGPGVFTQVGNMNVPVASTRDGTSAGSTNASTIQPIQSFLIPQSTYTGGRRNPDKKYQPPNPCVVNIPASDALANHLPSSADWTRAAWHTLGDDRTMKKFQIRFQFSETLGLEDYVSLQHNERCIELPPHNTIPRDPSRPWGKLQRRKSRLRSTRSLLYLIAKDLSCFLASLKLKNTPLTINGLEVDFNDILIVDIHRPTKGSIQPQLAILPTALAKYNLSRCSS